MTLHNGSTLAGPRVGTPAVVDRLDNWDVRVTAPANPVPSPVSVESSAGGTLTNLGLTAK